MTPYFGQNCAATDWMKFNTSHLGLAIVCLHGGVAFPPHSAAPYVIACPIHGLASNLISVKSALHPLVRLDLWAIYGQSQGCRINNDKVSSLRPPPLARLEYTGSASQLYCPHQQQCRWAIPLPLCALLMCTASCDPLEELQVVLLEILQVSLTCQLWGGPACLLQFCSNPIHALGIHTLVQIPLPG